MSSGGEVPRGNGKSTHEQHAALPAQVTPSSTSPGPEGSGSEGDEEKAPPSSPSDHAPPGFGPTTDRDRLENRLGKLWDKAVSICSSDQECSPRAYVELCLVVSRRCYERDVSFFVVKTSSIRTRLSDSAEKSMSGKGGPTGVTSDDSTVQVDQHTSVTVDENGTEHWKSGEPKWKVGTISMGIETLLADLDLSPSPATLADIAESKNCESLFSPPPPKPTAPTSSLDGPPTTTTRTNTGTGHGSGSGFDPESSPGASTSTTEDTHLGTTGLDSSDGATPENQQSDRSDGDSEVDICLVNPPVQAHCNRDQWAWLTRRTESIREQWLFLDLVESRRVATYASGEAGEDGWVGYHHRKDLHERFKVSYPTATVWMNSDLVEVKKDGRYISPEEAKARDVEAKSRELRVKEEALEKWTELGVEGESYRYKAHRRELVRTDEPQPMTTDFYDENRNEIPPVVEEALEVLSQANHRIDLDAIEEAEEAISEREGSKARDQLTSLRLAKETVKRQVIQSQNGVAQLQNAYRIQSISGRTSFKRGGPLGLMAEVKARAYDLDNYRNYDIRSCHTTAFEQVAEMLAEVDVHISVAPWKQYPGKYQIAAQTGLPVGLIKVVEHAVKYGAVLPVSVDQAEYYESESGHYPEVAAEVEHYVDIGRVDDADEALRTLNSVFEEMRKVVVEIAEALLNDYYDATHSGGWMKNACGVSFAPHQWDEGHERRSKVMAWMLQGLEAAFCHHLTILSAGSDAFSVVANEHDGLIIRKDAEEEESFQKALRDTIEEACERSGFHLAEFVEKAHADEEEVEELYGSEDGERSESSTGAQPQENKDDWLEDFSPSQREAIKKHSRRASTWRAENPEPDLTGEEVREMRSKSRPNVPSLPPELQTPPSSAPEADRAARERLERKRRVREGDVPDFWEEAREEGFRWREWERAKCNQAA